MDPLRLDAIVFPTKAQTAAPLVAEGIARKGLRGQPELASYSGFPELTIPIGLSSGGLPVGLSLFGRAWSEPLLFDIGRAFEQTGPRPEPALEWQAPHLPALPSVSANARFEHRIRLEGGEGAIRGNNFGADIEPDEPRHGLNRYIDRSVWYTWTAPSDGEVILDTADSAPARHRIAVYAGERLRELELVVSNNEFGKIEDTVQFPTMRGKTYQIAIGSNATWVQLGDIILKWSFRES
jgi:hypothetical protein